MAWNLQAGWGEMGQVGVERAGGAREASNGD